RGRGLPDGGGRRSDGEGCGPCARRASRRRRHDRERSAHAVSGRHARRAGLAQRGARDDRAGRGVRGRHRGRVLAGPRIARRAPSRRQALGSVAFGGRARAPARGMAQGGRALPRLGLTATGNRISRARPRTTISRFDSSMTDLPSIIEARFRDALAKAFGDEHRSTDPLVRPSADERFGDYQANVAMSLAKTLGAKPRDVAASIVAALDAADLFERVEIAGPGFINLTLAASALARHVEAMHADERLGVEPETAQRIVVDYSGPNVAKEMHVGHLRSTCIGDAIARVLRFLGHDVIGQNHLGDWGTQFGMLIEYLMETGGTEKREIADLNAFYQEAKRRFDDDPAFAERARLRVVALQRGDTETLELWRMLVDESKRYFDTIYERLDIDRSLLEYRGESSYNDDLDDVIRGLEEAGLLRESEGALVVYPQGF